jgi:hypothetical protein
MTSTLLLASCNSSIHDSFNIPLQPLAEILKHGRTTREDNVLVQSSPDIDRRGLDNSIDNFGEGGQEIGRIDFGIEKDFRGEETFVSDI